MKFPKVLQCVELLMLCALCAPPVSPQGPTTQDLRLTIQLEKTTYRLGELIPCRVFLENVSDKHLVVNNRLLVNIPIGPHELFFQIIGPDKKTVPFVTKIRASFESTQYVALLPNHFVGLVYDLAKDHALTQRGRYTVRAYYENRYEAPTALGLPPAWRGSVESNRVRFILE